MDNKKYNGFASEEQYLAVKKAVNDAVDREEIDVNYNADCGAIYVDGWFYSFNIIGDMLTSIEIEDSSEFDGVMAIYDSIGDIWTAFEQYQPKEQSV